MFTGLCHCKSCQKSNGGAFNVIVAIPSAALTVTGETKQYDSKGDSGQGTHHSFCPNCGSPITGQADVMAGITMIAVGTLDDPSWVKPAMEIYTDSKLPWVSLGGILRSFPKMPG